MIVRAADQKCSREGLLQRTRHLAQQLVALFKAVLAVVVLHGNDVRVDQNRRPAEPANGIDPLLGKLDHVVQIGQPGQAVGVEQILLEELSVLRQLVRFVHAAGHVQIENAVQLRPVRHGLPGAVGMDVVIHTAARVPRPIDLIVEALLADEGLHGRHGFRGVLRVEQLQPAGRQNAQQLFPLHTHQLTQPVRHQKRNKAVVLDLIIGQGRQHRFIMLAQFFRKLVHKMSLCFLRSSRIARHPGARARMHIIIFKFNYGKYCHLSNVTIPYLFPAVKKKGIKMHAQYINLLYRAALSGGRRLSSARRERSARLCAAPCPGRASRPPGRCIPGASPSPR